MAEISVMAFIFFPLFIFTLLSIEARSILFTLLFGAGAVFSGYDLASMVYDETEYFVQEYVDNVLDNIR